MPSHELPLVYPGMVWDGVTEYQDIPPPDTLPLGVWLVRLVGDGSRRIIGSLGVGFPMQYLRIRTADGWERIGVTHNRPFIYIDGDLVRYDTGNGFLNYDGTLSFEAPNQFHQLNPFREHAAASRISSTPRWGTTRSPAPTNATASLSTRRSPT